jgi:hypothetical protein
LGCQGENPFGFLLFFIYLLEKILPKQPLVVFEISIMVAKGLFGNLHVPGDVGKKF